MLALSHINYFIGRHAILKDISLKLHPGNLVVLIGPNGAGKSSIIKSICDDVKLQSGEILWNGKSMHQYNRNSLATQRAVLTQQLKMSLEFKVKEVVMMGRYPYFSSEPKSEDYEKVDRALEITELTHLAERNYNQLSGGEQQRVQLARIIAQLHSNEHPSLMLLDEPLNNLDLRFQHQTLKYCKAFAKEGNLVVVVLHDLNLAAHYADEIVLMSGGKLFAHGTVEEVMTDDNLSEAYNYPMKTITLPEYNSHIVISQSSNENYFVIK